MRHRLYGGSLLAVATLLAGSATAQTPQGPTDYAVPGMASENVPLPTGNPGTHGVYTFGEFMILTQTWTVGKQVVAYRGLVDSRGRLTGQPGTYIGSGAAALNTSEFPRRSWQPGYNIGIGYKTDDGISVYGSYTRLADRNYHAGATLASPFFRGNPNLSDTFLVAGVYNFPPQYSGPAVKTPFDDIDEIIFDDPPNTSNNNFQNANEGGNFYGIWNGASVMDIQYNQWWTTAEIGARVPMFQTEYSRVYGTAGARFNWFMERFKWRTVSFAIDGSESDRWTALYQNTLSQRMYGPFVGCGHEVHVGKRFSVSLDTTAALLINVIKERAKYELGSDDIQNKMSRDELGIVPSLTAHANIWWYPLEGVQVRVGYNAWTFFNTKNLDQPIGFNYSVIDPVYSTQYFRIVHGLNVGLGLFF
jgi:hypothetical protein